MCLWCGLCVVLAYSSPTLRSHLTSFCASLLSEFLQCFMNLSIKSAAGKSPNELLSVSFNQDSSCFACGTTDGFVVYNIAPFGETFRRIFVSGGIGIVEMLFRCNLLAIVGGGRNPRYPPNKVMIWDDRQNRCVGELLFKTEVYAVRLRRDRVVVVLANKVHVHRFKDLKLLQLITTADNTSGLIAQSISTGHNVLAVPGLVPGSVRVELFDLGKCVVVTAHVSELAAIALSADGDQLATASGKGTIVRVWDTVTGIMLRELRRGSDRAEIYSLAFNSFNTYLACSSDKGTIHVFSLVRKDDVPDTALVEPMTMQSVGQAVPSAAGAGANASEGGANTARTAQTTDEINSVFMAKTLNQSTGMSGSSGSGAAGSAATSAVGTGLAYLQTLIPESVVPKYFSSEWSYAQVRGIEGRAICAFDSSTLLGKAGGLGQELLVVLSSDGVFTKVVIPSNPGDCPRLAVHSFVRSSKDEAGVFSGHRDRAGHEDTEAATAGSGKYAALKNPANPPLPTAATVVIAAAGPGGKGDTKATAL